MFSGIIGSHLAIAHNSLLFSEEQNPRKRPQFLQPPRWISSPHVPLAGRIHVHASVPCGVRLDVRGADEQWTLESSAVSRQEHTISVTGLRPDRTYEIAVEISDGVESLRCTPLVIHTPPLPSNFPGMQLVSRDTARQEPGVTLMTILRWESNAASLTEGWFIAVNESAEPVWYLQLSEPAGAIRRLSNGNFLYLHGAQPTGLREIDPLGHVVRQFRATGTGARPREGEIPVDVDTFHHDCLPLENGNLLVLTTEVRRVEDFPVSEARPDLRAPAQVVGDVIVELRPDGSIARKWPLLDLLDPARIGYGSLDSFWDLRAYPFLAGGTRDWSHGNSLAYLPEEDALLVCLRHQDAVIKIDCEAGRLCWILGPRQGWREPWASRVLRPLAGTHLPFHAHGIKTTPEGHLLLFDNGNCRRVPPARPVPASLSYSRAVELKVDEAAGTVETVWEYGERGRGRFFSAFVGDVVRLPRTGNYLITDGGRLESRTGAPLGEPPGEVQWGRILEIDPRDADQVVFELHVREPVRNSDYGSSIYRSERLPDFRIQGTISSAAVAE